MEGVMRIRSSIACMRCRKSKIKCDNTGRLDIPCENCTKSGHECVWPGPTPLPPKRSQTSSTTHHNTDAGPSRKRLKRPGNATRQDCSQDTEDILITRRIDRGLWDKILVTYQHHFSTELPFLHIPTLKNRIYNLSTDKNPVPPDVHLVLLGLLALTGRYHPELIKYTEYPPKDGLESQSGRNAMTEAAAVADYFARALDRALGSFVTMATVGSVERVQALLMLGLYEWISPNHEGLRAWMLIGAAGRMAQALKLGYEVKPGSDNKHLHPSDEEFIVDCEVRRRTMFSCFIFDRLVSCGKERASFIRPEDLYIQLPCAKEDFELSRRVITGSLSVDSHGSRKVPNPNVLSRFIQLVDLWGHISQYSNSGGRFTEKDVPPWSHESKFFQLRRQIEDFSELLETPGTFLSLSPSNYFRHENCSGTYIILHMLLSLCKVMLHREYIPFIAIKCDKPSGPLDEPTFPPDIVPLGFWEDSARELFKANRTVVDLIQLCGEKLPHSPLVAFVVYTASFDSIYARHFPHMDIEHAIVSKEDMQNAGTELKPNSASIGVTKITFEALTELAKYSGVASAFVARFKEVDQYFVSLIQDYRRNLEQRGSSAHHHGGAERLSIRMGGNTGGLEEWVERSESMVGNSSIIKESDLPITPTHQVRIPGLRSLVSGERSHTNTPNLQMRTPLRKSPSLPADHQAGHSSSQVTPGLVDNGVVGTIGQSSPLSVHTAQEMSDNPILLEDGLDWSWAYLHDMYMGSVYIDPVDLSPENLSQ